MINNGSNKFTRKEYFTYSVIIVYTAILSVARQKAPHYFYPVVPYLSIVVAQFLYESITKPQQSISIKWFYGARNIMFSALWIVVFLAIAFIFKTISLFIWVPVLGLLAVAVYFMRKSENVYNKLIFPLVISSIALNFVINAHFIPAAFQYHGGIKASAAYDKLALDDEELFTYKFGQFETYFYPKKISHWVNAKEELEQVLRDSRNLWVVADREGIAEVRAMAGERIAQEEVFKHRLISRMSGTFLNPLTREQELESIYLLKIE